MSRHRYVKSLNIAGKQTIILRISCSYARFIDELDDDALSDVEDEMTAEEQRMCSAKSLQDCFSPGPSANERCPRTNPQCDWRGGDFWVARY